MHHLPEKEDENWSPIKYPPHLYSQEQHHNPESKLIKNEHL